MESPKSAAQAVRLGTQKKADVIAKTEECGGRISSSSEDLELPWWLVVKNPPANTGD